MVFNLDKKEKLNQSFILSKLTEEQILCFYLGRDLRSKKLFRSKLRNDSKPTCSVYRNKSNHLIYKDFATGQSLNCFAYVMEMFGCSYYKALQIIANDFGLIKDSSISKNKGLIVSRDFKIKEQGFSKIQIQQQDFTKEDIEWWNKYGITLEILHKYRVYSCKHVFLNDNIIAESTVKSPIFGYYGGKYQGNELWRIYFPYNPKCKFIGNWSSIKIQGIENIPNSGKLLVITKSLKDCMSLHSLGIPAIAPNSETQFIGDSLLEELQKRFKYIIVFFDNDYTGISFMNKLKRKYPKLIYTWIPRKYKCKDISDFYKTYKKPKTTELIKTFIKHIKDENNKNN